jgi:hypothetical protein
LGCYGHHAFTSGHLKTGQLTSFSGDRLVTEGKGALWGRNIFVLVEAARSITIVVASGKEQNIPASIFVSILPESMVCKKINILLFATA